MAGFAIKVDDAGVHDLASSDGAESYGAAADDAEPPPLNLPTPSGFVWEHYQLHGDEPLPERHDERIPEVVANALTATETRPRCDQFGEGALVNLRGLAEPNAPGTDELVSIRIWAQAGHVVTVDRRRLAAVQAVEQQMRAGELRDPGDLVSSFARHITADLDPLIADLGDHVDECESQIQEANIYTMRTAIARARANAIAYRRFIAPDRDALTTLAGLRVPWLAEDDRLHIREAADRFARMAEELESTRERSALLHEQLTDLRTELIDQRSLSIAVVAFIFLPLTFVTGLLGMNVDGIPYQHHPYAFWGVVAFCAAIGLPVIAWFAKQHWLRQ